MSCYGIDDLSNQILQERKKATIIVTDPDANKFDESIDRIMVSISSDTDPNGIVVTAYETHLNSGVFEGTVLIDDDQSTQNKIHVVDGDSFYAKYVDTTLPPESKSDSLEVTTSSIIGVSCPPLERVPTSGIRIEDNKGNDLQTILVDQQVQIRADLANPSTRNETFAYIVQIQDKDGFVESLSWLAGTLIPSQAFSPSVSWTPEKTGNYTTNVFVWESISNPNALSPPISIDLIVLPNSTTYDKSLKALDLVISSLKQFKSGTDPYFIKCRENLELVIKLRDNSPACVKPTSLERLLKQEWIYVHDNNGKYNRNGKSTTIDELSSTCENEFKPKDFEFSQFLNGTSRTINYVPVFLLKLNSTGKICVNYWQTSPEMNYSGKVIAGIGKDNSAIQDVTVVAYPDTITIDNTNKTITYVITSSKESGGFYRFSPMFSNCGGIPIAIGYNLTHSFDNDFPWLWDVLPCPLPVANYQITGLTGIDVAYITKEYR